MAKVQINSSEVVELKEFISKKPSHTDGAEFRDVDSLINYTSNIIDNLSSLVSLLFEKGLLSKSDIMEITSSSNIKIIE